MTRIKYEFQNFLFRSQGDMLRAMAETWLSSDGSTSEEGQREILAEQTNEQLAAECIEGWGLDEGGDVGSEPWELEDERSHMAFNGYDAGMLAAAFADLRLPD